MLIRPRLTDHFGIQRAQTDLDFAIPFLSEDIPLYLDPFMLWRSPSQADQALHTSLINAFNHLGWTAKGGNTEQALATLIAASECDGVGLDQSSSRIGKRIGRVKAAEILDLFASIPRYANRGFTHFEEMQLYVGGVSKDRISDIACSFLKSHLIDFTQSECGNLRIPMRPCRIGEIYSSRENRFLAEDGVNLPVNPEDAKPVIFVPKRWLRFTPWINFDDYFEHHCPQDELSHEAVPLTHVAVLNHNRHDYGRVNEYVRLKERTAEDCASDPLFSQIPVSSAKRKLASMLKLATGKGEGADRKYEDCIGHLLPSLLYPDLDFAAVQSRTESGVSIRDLVFYNTRRTPFLEEIHADYGSRQITFEMKNVAAVERVHIDQVNRYLADDLGRFGVLVTRRPLGRAETKRVIDLWSGQRKAIVVLTDDDVSQMVEVFEGRQRNPLDVIVKKYVEFRRLCP